MRLLVFAWMLLFLTSHWSLKAQEVSESIGSASSDVMFVKAVKLFSEGKYQTTVDELENIETTLLKASKKNNSTLPFISYWKGICFNRLQEFEKAINSFQKSLSLGYAPLDIHYEYGQALYASEKYKEARVQFRESYLKKFKRGVSLYYIAYLSKELGELERARSFYKSINKLNEEEVREVRQAAELQIAEMYLEQVEKRTDPFSSIESVVIPQYVKALEVDKESALAPIISEKIVKLQKKYDLVMFQLRNGRPTLIPPHFLRFSEELGLDTNVTFSPAETTVSKSKQKSIYSKSDFIGKYTFYHRDYLAISPEFRFNFTHYFNRVPEIYRNDNMLIAPAVRTSFEHQLWKKPASFLFDYDYNEAKRDVNSEKKLEFNSRTHTFMIGERFNYFSSGESVLRLRYRKLESYLASSDSKMTSFVFEHINSMGANTLLFFSSYDLMRVDNNSFDTNALTLRGDLIMARVRDWFTPSLGLSLTSTDPINARSTRGRELLINPNLRIAKTFQKSWRANLKYDYQKNNSKDEENFAYKKSVYALEIEYLF
jgi:tetratricopeptide (TPR) repeat protein